MKIGFSTNLNVPGYEKKNNLKIACVKFWCYNVTMNSKKSFITAFALFFISVSAFSQIIPQVKTDQTFTADYVSKNWTTEDGLPGMTITTVLQDNTGYMWIGTYDGLVRFDGVEFKTYSRSNDPRFDFASARSLCQASDGKIWIGHNDEGVTSYVPNGEIKKYTMALGLPNNKVNSVCEDLQHNIWVGTASGLCYITPENEIKIPNGLAELGQEKILVQEIYCDTAGRMWITTGLENDFFVYENNVFQRYEGIKAFKNPTVRCVTQDDTGAFWFGVDPHYAVKSKNGEETVFDISHDHHAGTMVNEIIQDAKGNIWFGLDSGLTVLHNSTYAYFDKRNGMPDEIISKILEDKEGNIWIGCDRGGLVKISRSKFSTVPYKSSVNVICEDVERHCTWLGTDSGVACYKDNDFVENKVTEITKGYRVRHIELTSDNELLICSYSNEPLICIYPNDDVKVWKVKDGIANNKCRLAKKISTGDYYVATTSGLSIIHHEDGHISTLTRDDGFSNHYIMWIYEDPKNQVWIGTNGGGVHVLKDEKIIKHYTTNENEGGLAGNVIFKILNNNNSIWIGTGTGLSKYIEETDSFVNYTSRNGIGTDSVFQMICDYTQTVWMTTNKGIFSSSLAEMEEVAAGKRDKITVKYYGASDGLITSGVTSTSLSSKDSLGRVWFTLVDGFAIYDPVKSEKKSAAPKAVFQQYTIDDHTYECNGSRVVVAPADKRISVKFTALSYISPENTMFSYMLEGFEKKYSEWTNARTVSYTNLKPGTYRFAVMTQNADGVISEPNYLTIVKKPYIWQKPWFWISAFVLVGFFVFIIVYTVIKYRIKKIEAKAEEERRFNKAIIGAFANCVDGKDEYTNGHSQRVAKYTKMLAEKLGEDPQTVDKYYNIALLHDIGKIGIPDAILQKPGKLTEDEFATMKGHPYRGYEILKDVQIQEDLAAGAHHHHERYDGKGYPDGLVGQNIPFVARIIAVADTFDAMSSNRPYRKKLPEDYIINEIKHCGGTQLDPLVVEKFLELYEEGAFKDVFDEK